MIWQQCQLEVPEFCKQINGDLNATATWTFWAMYWFLQHICLDMVTTPFSKMTTFHAIELLLSGSGPMTSAPWTGQNKVQKLFSILMCTILC